MLKITSHTQRHSFNKDKRYYVTSSIEKNVDRLIEDLDKAFAKYPGAYHIGSKSKISAIVTAIKTYLFENCSQKKGSRKF